jgi:hypothetical protein
MVKTGADGGYEVLIPRGFARGNIVTHLHPNESAPYLSAVDLQYHIMSDVRETRAVSRNQTVSFQVNTDNIPLYLAQQGGFPPPGEAEDIWKNLSREVNRINDEIRESRNFGIDVQGSITYEFDDTLQQKRTGTIEFTVRVER